MRVRPLHRYRSTVQPRPISQSRCCPSPHFRFKNPALLPVWAFGRSQWRPGPAIRWLAAGAERGRHRTSDTSRQVMHISSDG